MHLSENVISRNTQILACRDEVFEYDNSALEWKCSGHNSSDYWGAPQGTSWEPDSDGTVKISFKHLLQLTKISASKIYAQCSSQCIEGSLLQQPVYAISIPEGPYLQIAVLCTHFQNVLFGGDLKKSPIILPLCPNEGMERLVQMIADAKPTVILYAKETDGERINDAIVSTKLLPIHKMQQYSPLVVNLKTMLEASSTVEEDLGDFGAFQDKHLSNQNRISHIVYTSGTTGKPKGCVSSLNALLHYIQVKNEGHSIISSSRVFLASALPFDPCLSDIVATFYANATLCICTKEAIRMSLSKMLVDIQATHILCTPSLWSGVVSENRGQLGNMQVVALGGEVISRRIIGWWARRNNEDEGIRLLSTYGVTEACVYQTIGELFADYTYPEKGHNIGFAFDGTKVEIWNECNGTDKDISNKCLGDGSLGEIVLNGKYQIDELSGYLNMPQVSRQKFHVESSTTGRNDGSFYYYRTGDRGLIDPKSGALVIMGRIAGEQGMIKINGVRVELGEIEIAILDSNTQKCPPVAIGCVVTVKAINDDGEKRLTAYCVLDQNCMDEVKLSPSLYPANSKGIICTRSPLLTLLRARCAERVRKGCTPSTFIILKHLPLTRTGKIDRKGLPSLQDCSTLEEAKGFANKRAIHLSNYGRCGCFLSQEMISCLNLLPTQKQMLTIDTNFAMLGGDSLAATRIVRSIYASHHGLQNKRTLGGEFGAFEGPFNVSNLIRASSLGSYVDFLDASGVFLENCQESVSNIASKAASFPVAEIGHDDENNVQSQLFNALLEAITMEQTSVAVSLLNEGANPNFAEHGKRLGKLKNGRLEQRESFRSNPMHIACVRGDDTLVGALIRLGACNCKSPDSSGSFPLHLACSGLGQGIGISNDDAYDEVEDRRRLNCVRILLDEGGVPLSMKNQSKQTCLHCATRGGYRLLLQFLLQRWEMDEKIKAVPLWGTCKADWQDRWHRSCVHWAVLHCRLNILRTLLQHGCSTNPPKPRSKTKRTSGAVEFPIEICERLYSESSDVGVQIRDLLSTFNVTNE